MRLSTCLLLTGLFACGNVLAHGLWTEQRRGNIETVYGHGEEDNAFDATKISGAWAYDRNGKMIPVTVERLADHARLQPLKPPAIMAVALDNGAWSKTPDGQWINQGRSQVPNSTQSLHTYKYSLAIYSEGARLPELKQLKMVIVPEVDPLQVGPANRCRCACWWTASPWPVSSWWAITGGAGRDQRHHRCRRPRQGAGTQSGPQHHRRRGRAAGQG